MLTPVSRGVACPRCGAQVGTRCSYPSGLERAAHKERVAAYLKTPDGDPFKNLDSRKSDGDAPDTVNIG